MMLEESSEDDSDNVEVYSVKSSDEESQESSVLEDFDDMFHDTKRQATLHTQPPPKHEPRRPSTPKVIHGNKKTPKSLTIGHFVSEETKRRPGVSLLLTPTTKKSARVSLSPSLHQPDGGSKVTVLEQVVTECSNRHRAFMETSSVACEIASKRAKRCRSHDSASLLTTTDGQKEGKPLAKKDVTKVKESDSFTKAGTNETMWTTGLKETVATQVSDQKSSLKKGAVKKSPKSTHANTPDKTLTKVSDVESSKKIERSKPTKGSKDDSAVTKVSGMKPSAKKDATKAKEKSIKLAEASNTDKTPPESLKVKASLTKRIAEDIAQLTKANMSSKFAAKGSDTKLSSRNEMEREALKSTKSNKANKTLPADKGPDTDGVKSSEAAAGKRKSSNHHQPPKKKNRTFQDQILFHMLTDCKPFSLKSLAQSLQTTEASINYALMSLLDKGLVIKKDFATGKSGRTKELYWANQDSAAKEVLALLPSPQEIQAAQEEYRELQKEDFKIAIEMNVLQQEPDNVKLTAELVEMEKALLAFQGRLKETKDRVAQGTLKKSAPPNCPRRMKLLINAMRDEWKKRKTMCMDFVDQLADGMEKKPKDVIKLLDLETDEMEKVIMPPKHVL